MREVVKAWRQSKSVAVIVPKCMAEKLGIVPGSFIELVLEEDEIRMRKI